MCFKIHQVRNAKLNPEKISKAFKEQELHPDEFPEKEEFDDYIYKIFEKLVNERVVVVGECTC